MLIKITQQCGRGCSHCMEDSKARTGEHMKFDTFKDALRLTRDTEWPAWRLGVPPLVLLSGGECTEHPQILRFINEVERVGMLPLLITNGEWLADRTLRSLILKEKRNIRVQVTYDPRFYPGEGPPRVVDSRVLYVETLTHLLPLGRMARRPGEADKGIPLRASPSSADLRLLVAQGMSFSQAVCFMRTRYASGQSQTGQCTPSINYDGTVHAGETRNCFVIGTVKSSNRELTEALRGMGSCNRCGLEDGLYDNERHVLNLEKTA
jgi:MoaA/NifB/PqqE/SkfB family radical SAM enzyme